ncbi:MAG: hypothetical protein CM1200mP28_07510 [Deltaproteobacteria bacterium]|nr:MAG: hypothetical protein CM1200mP28_07510 [Deltaproteobacteria bacterium]
MDFPKLVHRHKAIRSKDKPRNLREKILGNPDKSAGMARASFGLANLMNRFSIPRWFMEKIMVYIEKNFCRISVFPHLNNGQKTGTYQGKSKSRNCAFSNFLCPAQRTQIGKDTLEVLEKNKVDCACVKGLRCCGMPAWEQGDLETLRFNAKLIWIFLFHL